MQITDIALEHLNWVRKVILSCRNTFQIECCKALIESFKQKYPDETLATELHLTYNYVYNQIHSILN